MSCKIVRYYIIRLFNKSDINLTILTHNYQVNQYWQLSNKHGYSKTTRINYLVESKQRVNKIPFHLIERNSNNFVIYLYSCFSCRKFSKYIRKIFRFFHMAELNLNITVYSSDVFLKLILVFLK